MCVDVLERHSLAGVLVVQQGELCVLSFRIIVSDHFALYAQRGEEVEFREKKRERREWLKGGRLVMKYSM